MTLVPPMFPKTPLVSEGPSTGTVRPFGLTLALPVVTGTPTVPDTTVTYSEERQVMVTSDGLPHAPSAKTERQTVSQTRVDMQLFTDNENDTD
ncbi:putative ATP-grasp-modified RiPP [Streptomyces sp. NPDC059816]|uniref:putative ATP-grasp-modified RiPP n=1 Tax=Streptomyces sp. NPDC059816 TaxID=3346960 RepID=UPI0036484D3B